MSKLLAVLAMAMAIALVAAAGVGAATPGGMAHGDAAMRHGMRGPAMMHQLDLTDTQKQRLRELRERQARHDIQARADLQLARLDLRRLMTSDHPDAGAIDTQIDKLSRLRADRQKERVATMLEARALLSPEQRAKWRELHGDMGPRRGMPGARMRERMRDRRDGDGDPE
jgi:Spy/CpxP family protein refolding chaperone